MTMIQKNDTRKSRRIAVVGGGVSGIAAAWYLSDAGFEVDLIERGDTLGGRVGTGTLGDRAIDFGGKNIGLRYSEFRTWARAQGNPAFRHFGLNSTSAEHSAQGTMDSKRRVRGFRDMLRGIPARDLGAFVALAAAVKISRAEGDIGGPLFRFLSDRLDARPASEVFSPAFAERVVRPLVLRMNGAEADEAYVGNLGTNLRLLFDDYEQLSGGMANVMHTFAGKLGTLLGTTVTGLVVSGGKITGLDLEGPRGRERRHYDGVVMAVPATVAARLVAKHDAELAQALAAIRYFPAATIVAEYDREIFGPKVRAYRFGREEPLSNAGVYGKDERRLVRYTFSGRAARALIVETDDALTLLPHAERTLAKLVPLDPSWRVHAAAMRWTDGLCAYGPYHHRTVDRLRSGSTRIAGLHLTGDYIRGVSIENCFRSARECAERVGTEQSASRGEVATFRPNGATVSGNGLG
jgi:oxygen-dependent protoporphyrinogen oxidase